MDQAVKDALRDLSDARVTLISAKRESDAKETVLNERRAALKALLDNGKTTGDTVRDLVVRSTGDINEELEEKYRRLEKRLTGFKDELMLLTAEVAITTMSRRGGPLPGQNWDRRDSAWTVACGVLANERLRLDGKHIALPVDQYAISSYIAGRSKYKTEINFRIDPDSKNPLHARNLVSATLEAYAEYDCGPTWNVPTFCIGDKEVREWFEREAEDQFEKCSELLGKSTLVQTFD